MMTRRFSQLMVLISVVGSGLLLASLVRMGRPAASQAAPGPAANPAEQPRAVLVDGLFDLGVLHPGEVKTHKFQIRNEGTAPLILELGSTTCKCTLADLGGSRLVAPGASTEIQLDWHAETPQFRFRQGATIKTNDPAQPTLELVGEGSVRVKFAALPTTAHLPDVPRNAYRELRLLVYSQAFPDVTVTRIESSLPKVRAELSPNVPEDLPIQEPRFVNELIVRIDPQDKAGHFEGTIRLDYRGRLPNGNEESGVCEVPVSFDVVGDVSLHGRDTAGRIVLFGGVRAETGAKKTVYVHLRDAVSKAQLTVARTSPEFLQAKLLAPLQLTPTLVRVPVEIEIPAGSPAANHTLNLGEIELHTSAPEHPKATIQVSFSVVP
jgi:hypothetical protein